MSETIGLSETQSVHKVEPRVGVPRYDFRTQRTSMKFAFGFGPVKNSWILRSGEIPRITPQVNHF
jgi:hypothetical protein